MALVLPLAGCGPDCRAACRHVLLDCGIERPDYDVDDCEEQCSSYVDHYEDDWQKEQSRASVRCVRNASCDELRSGTPCYDAAVYVW
jgi:hypothetical protein